MAGMGLALALNRAKSASKIRRTTAPETTSQELSMMPAETSGVDETLLDDVSASLMSGSQFSLTDLFSRVT